MKESSRQLLLDIISDLENALSQTYDIAVIKILQHSIASIYEVLSLNEKGR